MSENYSRSLLRISVAQICQNLGWNSAQNSSLEVLTDVLERYLLQLGGISHRYSEQFGRTEPNLDDVSHAFQHMCIDVSELEDYVHHVDPVPFAHELVAFPVCKSSTLEFPNPQSREILLHREEHVNSHLPYMFPHLKDEMPQEDQTKNIVNLTSEVKEEHPAEDTSINGESVGDKRPATNGALELTPNKRQRMGNSGLLDDASQSQYEMTCVFMNQNGFITTRPGCHGKKPEARLPPPNPRNIRENNKENKVKDSSNGSKQTITGGGLGADTVVKSKSSKKSSHKKSLHIHETAAKAALEMTNKEIGKKSASSKAAAKFIKKLKTSKKSAKIFGKKHKDSKSHDNDVVNSHPNSSDLHKAKSGRKKKKEKKSAAIIDSDEELRNLSSPSPSKVPSPEHSAMDSVKDSIDAVLRDGRVDRSKLKKKKKKEAKTVQLPVVSKEEPEVKPPPKRKGRPPGRKSNKDKKPEPPPPQVDIKPFVSDKYSSAELQVYEFNDSPPDGNSIKSRRPSAPDENQTSPAPHPSSPAPPPKTSSRSTSHGHQKSIKIVEQEELFAPEIKIESIKPSKLDMNSEKDKSSGKKEKTHEEKDKRKIKNEREAKRKERKDDDNKEKVKDKVVRKEKKDKKKDKDKKKKHKEKDRDRDKEKEKRRDEKVKQEAKESRESSPALSHGVKLKIKIGGSAGPSASVMVTGEENPSSASPSLPRSEIKRESMSPPKVVPKLYISKKGPEEKMKKSVKHGSNHKSSPLSISIKSSSLSPSSNAASPTPSSVPSPLQKSPAPIPTQKSPTHVPVRKSPVHVRKSPTPVRKSPTHVPIRKTPTPPPFAQYSDHKSMASPKRESPAKETLKKSKGGRLSRKDKEKKKGLKPAKSAKPTKPAKPASLRSAPKVSPKRTRQSSSSLDHSPLSRSPEVSKSRSPSINTRRNSASPSPSNPRRKRTSSSPSPSNSKGTSRRQHQQSPSPHLSPSKPPTPGSTSPNAMLDWNLQESPLHHSPINTVPNTPTGSPHRSPSHSSLPRTPNPHRSPSPVDSPHTSPIGRTDTPELKEVVSPASSGKSSVGAKSRTVEAETVCVFYDDMGQKVWICPACKLQDDGSDMIGCDRCDNWYHWPCVGITSAPPEEQSWFCTPCTNKAKSSSRGGTRGRGRPRGRGRGRGRKKVT